MLGLSLISFVMRCNSKPNQCASWGVYMWKVPIHSGFTELLF
jgi:hypothetical protein